MIKFFTKTGVTQVLNGLWKSCAPVRERFETYFATKENIVFYRARFFQRTQEEGKPITSFGNEVYALAKYCNFDALHHELVKDIQ